MNRSNSPVHAPGSAARSRSSERSRARFDTARGGRKHPGRVGVPKLQDQLHQRNKELEHLSRTDMLTGLYSRRHLEEELARRHRDSLRHQDPLCVVVLDIDHFKGINDTHGHAAGDEVLRIFSVWLREELRAGDIGGRWGGEEFLLILARTDPDDAVSVAKRVRRRTSAEPLVFAGRSIPVTLSGGCAAGPADTPDALVALADAQLYQAKLAGRDRIGRKEA